MNKKLLFLSGLAIITLAFLLCNVLADGVLINTAGVTTTGTVGSAQLGALADCFPAATTNNQSTPMVFSNKVTISSSTVSSNVTFIDGDGIKSTNANTRAYVTITNGAIQIFSQGGSVNTFMRIGVSDAHIIDSQANALGQSYALIGDTTSSGGPAQLKFGSGATITFQSTTRSDAGSTDTGIARNAAGVVEVNNGTAANFTATLKTGSGIFTNTVTATNGIATYKNNGAAPTSITVGASEFLYTNTQTVNIQVFVDANGATTSVKMNGTAIFSTLVGGDHTIILQPQDYIGVTYSVQTPLMRYREF